MIHPVDGAVHGEVDGQSGRMDQGINHKILALSAVHPGGFDARIASGLRPVELTQQRINGQGGGCVYTARNDTAPVSSVAFGRQNLSFERRSVQFQPVKVLRHPIEGQGDRFGRFGEADDVLRVADLYVVSTFRNVRPADAHVHGIRPEDDVRVRIEIDRLDPLLVEQNFVPLTGCRVEGHHFASV